MAAENREFVMCFKTIRKFILSVIGIAGVTILVTLSVFPQYTDQEKKQIKNFGKSLKAATEKAREKTEKKEKPEEAEPADKTPDEQDVIKIETSLVRTDVLVVDNKGKAILGLKADDFIITENDVLQELGTFSLGSSTDVPRSIVLIIDYSKSQGPYIETSVEAAKVLVDKLNPDDKMAIVTDNIELLVPFSKNKTLLKKKLDSLARKAANKNVGQSLQYSALMATLNELFDDKDIRPIVIFQTDGDEAFDLSVTIPQPFGTSFTIQDLFNKIEKSRATIYSVISGASYLSLSPEERMKKVAMNTNDEIKEEYTPESLPQYLKAESERLYKQQTAMTIVARTSGGFSESLETPDQADAIYSRIFNGISHRYLIGYYPTNQERDGKRRNVKIEVRNHPEYVVWGRKFYYAPKEKKTTND